MSNTHTICGQAKWPGVACRYDRLTWIIAILKDEGVHVEGGAEFSAIASALLKAEANNFGAEKSVRMACFEAGIILENT